MAGLEYATVHHENLLHLFEISPQNGITVVLNDVYHNAISVIYKE